MKHPYTYEIIYSSRKTLAVQVTSDGTVKVRAPKGYPKTAIHNFLKEKENWILKHVDKAKQKPSPLSPHTFRKRQKPLHSDCPGYLYTKNSLLRFYHERNIWPYLNPRTKNTLGKLLQPGKPEL